MRTERSDQALPADATFAVSTLLMCVLSCWCALYPAHCAGGELSDAIALNRVLGDRHVEDNFRACLQQVDGRPAAQRMALLSDWVLPGPSHSNFRMRGEFRYLAGQAAELTGSVESLSAPALELVDAAAELGELTRLRERVQSLNAREMDDERGRQALLFLIALAENDTSSALRAADVLLDLSVKAELSTGNSRWPDLLVIWRGLQHPATRGALTDFFNSVYLDPLNYSQDPELDVQGDYLRKLMFLTSANPSAISGSGPPGSTDEWLPHHYVDSATHGLQRPVPKWIWTSEGVTKQGGHEMDYLAYRTPLRGNYEIEGDVTAGTGSHARLLVAGVSVSPFEGENRLAWGNFRKYDQKIELDPPLSPLKEWVRYRAVVRDGVLTHHINGRAVYQKILHPEYDPWVAVGSWRRSSPGVRDLRITGEVVVPRAIDLSTDPTLAGWAPYYESGFGSGLGNWGPLEEDGESPGILGRFRPELAGCIVEKFLRYHRPVWEDGEIEYEFLYEPGVSMVHPCVGRGALIVEEPGVLLHLLTDRRHETSTLDPANAVCIAEFQRGPDRLPLRAHAWNRMQLMFRGATVQVRLNDVLVYEMEFAPGSERTFGLFHYADRTEARVRHVRWCGDWPSELPAVERQRLAHSEVDALNASLAELPAFYEVDFRSGFPAEVFTATGDETYLRPLTKGVQMERAGGEGVEDLRTCLRLHGDYDITASFEDLQIQIDVPEWNTGIGLMTHLGNLSEESWAVYRRTEKSPEHHRVAYALKSRQSDGRLSYTGSSDPEESSSGRLRLARRGETVYALYAEEDSPNFRLIGKRTAPPDDLSVDGLRLLIQNSRGQVCRVTWTNLSVRAAGISNLPIQVSAPIVERVNAARDTLESRVIDFRVDGDAELPPILDGSGGSSSTRTVDGLRVELPRDEPSGSFSIRTPIGVTAPFDIAANLEIEEFEPALVVGQHNEIVMQVHLADLSELDEGDEAGRPPRVLEASIILRNKQPGVQLLIARTVESQLGGGVKYRVLRSLPVKSPDRFRIALHDGVLSFLYSEADSDEELVIAERPVPPGLLATQTVLTNYARSGQRNVMTWKSLTHCARRTTMFETLPLEAP